MKMFSDCSGECKDCAISYTGYCIAGHGDNFFTPVDYNSLTDELKAKYDRCHQKNEDDKDEPKKRLQSIVDNCHTHGWDGYNADPISSKVLNNALQVLPHMPQKFELFPTGRNSVQFEYETKKPEFDSNSGIEPTYYELEIFEEYADFFYVITHNVCESDLFDSYKEERQYRFDSIGNLIAWLENGNLDKIL